MWNIFEDDDGTYVVVKNGLGQHSLWPTIVAVPRGWETVYPDHDRRDCLDYIARVWVTPTTGESSEGQNAPNTKAHTCTTRQAVTVPPSSGCDDFGLR